MFIEDLIQKLYFLNFGINQFDLSIIRSLYNQYSMGTSFTEKQGNLAISLLKKHKSILSSTMNQDISMFLDNPVFKKRFRIINTHKLIDIVDHPTFKRAIRVSFPYDEKLINAFNKEKPMLNNVIWDNENKVWLFNLHEKNITFLNTLITEFNFIADDEFKNYVSQLNYINENLDKYITLISKVNDDYVLLNSPTNVDPTLGQELVPSLFAARKKGFFVWDDNIAQELSALENFDIVKSYLSSTPDKKFLVNLESTPLTSLETILKNLLPCLVIIPGGSELRLLEKNYNFLKTIGFDDSELSVLFRLSNDTDKNFNEYIKQNNLNNGINDKVKLFFISNNIPKTIIEHNINFNSILNYNYFSPHYKLKDFITHHHNVINICENEDQLRRCNFEFL
jgi:hypothetical protein